MGVIFDRVKMKYMKGKGMASWAVVQAFFFSFFL